MRWFNPKLFFTSFIKNYSVELALIAVAVGILIIASPFITRAKYASDIASKEEILNKKDTGIVLLDRNGKQFFSFNDGKFREYTPLPKISKNVQQAVIVAEDENFYEHNGVSFDAIVGAMIANFKRGDMAYGGSTITQQLVKNTILDNKRHLYRKYEEVVLAREMEERYTKEEILEMYLNTVYFGEGAYGIEEASRVYFNKHASQLTVSEASMIAGIIAAPSQLSPVSGDKKKAKMRQLYVLNEMVEENHITADEKNASYRKDLVYTNGRMQELYKAPHFALLVRDQLIRKYGEEEVATSGMKVHTTLDLSWQELAEKSVRKQVQNLAYNNGTNASVVVMDPKSGEVKALVGSVSWYDNKFGKMNMAVTPRQPGSAFKPIVFLAGFEEQKITPATVLLDAPRTFATNYRPKNYDERFRGPVSARYALANSLNVPSVDIMTRVGVDNALEMAKRLGINSLGTASDYGPSLVLGTGEASLLEMTTAYATFANNGVRHDPQLIAKVEDKHGKVIYESDKQGTRVIDEKYVFLISSILSDTKVRQDVFGNALDISKTAAVKTGTTENYRDAWTIGYTPSLAIGVWVGNNNNASMDKIAGSLGAAPIWRELMQDLTAGSPNEPFLPPSGVIATSVCPDGGSRGFRGSNVDTEYFIRGTESQSCNPVGRYNFARDDNFDNFIGSFFRRDTDKPEEPRVGGPAENPQPTLPPPSISPVPEQPQPPDINIDVPEANAEDDEKDKENRGNGRGRGGD